MNEIQTLGKAKKYGNKAPTDSNKITAMPVYCKLV